MEWLFGKRGNAAVDTECGLLRKQNESVRTVITKGRIPTLPPVVSVFAVPLHKLMKGSVTTGNQKSNCMEYETTIESENCFLVCDKNNRNNYTRVVKINVPTFLKPDFKCPTILKKWSVEGKEFYREHFAMEYAKTLLKTREKDNTKELKAIREKVRFLSYIISLVQEDPDLPKNYVMALSEIKKYIDRIIYGEN